MAGVCCVLLAPVSESRGQLWPSEDQRLSRGEVILSYKEAPDSSVHAVEGRILLDAPPDLVWSVITDYSSFPSIYPDISNAELLSRDGNIVRVKIKIKNIFLFPNLDYAMLVSEDPEDRSLKWDMQEGNLELLYGACSIQPFQDDHSRTKLVYTMARDPGWFLTPSFSTDLSNRSVVIQRLLGLRKEVRERKRELEENGEDSGIKAKWRKALFWWEKEEPSREKEGP